MKDFKKLKKIFADDPTTLQQLNAEEQTELLKEMKAGSQDNFLQSLKTVFKGDTGEPLTWEDLTDEQRASLKGADGITPTEEELTNLIKPLIPEPIPGKDGRDGVDGRDGRDGIDGVGKDGKDGSPDTPEQIVAKLNLLDNVLDSKVIIGYEDSNKIIAKIKAQKLELKDIKNMPLNMSDMRWHGGGISNITDLIQAGTNVTITGLGTTSSPYVINSSGGGGGGTWGSITGTLSDQTDLQTALDGKQATLVSGTNIKTINSTSILGSGNISAGGETLAQTLVLGNITGGENIILSSGDMITSPSGTQSALILTNAYAKLSTDVGIDDGPFIEVSSATGGQIRINHNSGGALNATIDIDASRIFIGTPSLQLSAPTLFSQVVSTSAGSAPLKFTLGGTLMTTPEAGAMEAINTHLYWTNSAGTRIQLDGSGGETLAQTLVLGSVTGGTDITMSSGDVIKSPSGIGGSLILTDTTAQLSSNNGVDDTSFIRITKSGGAAGIVLNVNSGGALYQTIDMDVNRIFIGGVLIELSSPVNFTQVVSTSAGTAPLKFTLGGTVMTTPEAGAVEATNTHLYWTDSAGTRFQLDQQGGASLWSKLDDMIYPTIDTDSLSIGSNTLNTGNNVAVGFGNSMTGESSIVVGLGNTMQTGSGSLVVGLGNTLDGSYSIIMGLGNTVTSDYSLIVGNGLTVTGNDRVVFGVPVILYDATSVIKSPSATGTSIILDDTYWRITTDNGGLSTTYLTADTGSFSVAGTAGNGGFVMDSSGIQLQHDNYVAFNAPDYTFVTLTPDTVPYLDASSNLVSSAVTPTELGYLSGVTSAIQTQLSAKLPLAGGIMTGNILMTSNKIIGGSTTTSDLFLQTTTGVGATGADMHFLVGNNGATEAMTILNSGFVGIGTTNPDIYGQGNSHFYTAISTAASGRYSFLALAGGATGGGELDFGNQTIRHGAVLSLDGSSLNFYTNTANSGTTISNKMTILANGNVGIGTTSPTAVLHLKAGTATAGTAPLKFTSGVLNTVSESGAIEFDGSNFYLNI